MVEELELCPHRGTLLLSTTSPTERTDKTMTTAHPICPRCQGYIPNNDRPGAYPGALSRLDNKTEICSDCGMEEALEEFFRDGITDWRITAK